MHLQEIAFHIAPGAHAVLLLDQAGWHGSAELIVPPNITLLPLPPRCPELNPVENVWQFMRDNWLSNRIFKSYDDIVEHCCFAWNQLVDQPWRIMSLGLRSWAHGLMGSNQCALVLSWFYRTPLNSPINGAIPKESAPLVWFLADATKMVGCDFIRSAGCSCTPALRSRPKVCGLG